MPVLLYGFRCHVPVFLYGPWEEGKRQIPGEERILLLQLVTRPAHDMYMCVSVGTLPHTSVTFREGEFWITAKED